MRRALTGIAAVLSLLGATGAGAADFVVTEPNVVVSEPTYAEPTYVAPAPRVYVAPRPRYVVTEPGPVVFTEPAPVIVTAPPNYVYVERDYGYVPSYLAQRHNRPLTWSSQQYYYRGGPAYAAPGYVETRCVIDRFGYQRCY
jgi:hypothetical protein